MTPRSLLFSEEARSAIYQGIHKIAKAVSSTMGPGGKNVVIKKAGGYPESTKDGVTVAKEINLKDIYEDSGAQAVKLAALKTNDEAGDGTTTATVLTNRIFQLSLKAIAEGHNPHSLKAGMDEAVRDIKKNLLKLSKPIRHSDLNKLKKIATISGNSSEIGELVAKAFVSVGEKGHVGMERGDRLNTYMEHVGGFVFKSGMESPGYINHPAKRLATLDKPTVLVTDKRFTQGQDIAQILDIMNQFRPGAEFLIISAGIDGDALGTVLYNMEQGNLRMCSLRPPHQAGSVEEKLSDIAAYCGAKFVSEKTFDDPRDFPIEALGTCESATISENSTCLTFDEKHRESFDQYLEILEQQDDTQERVSALRAKVAILKLSAPTSAELREVKDRYEDAINACRSALEMGFIPGAGVGFIMATKTLEAKGATAAHKLGYQIVLDAVKDPLATILDNSGVLVEIDQIVKKVRRKNAKRFTWTVDGLTGELVSATKAGILDPTKVPITALEAAVSIAGTYMKTECLIVEDIEE